MFIRLNVRISTHRRRATLKKSLSRDERGCNRGGSLRFQAWCGKFRWMGKAPRQDSNLRPPPSESGALIH